MFKYSALLALVALMPAIANAQSPLYGQCGGIGWSGATTCVSGSSCQKLNDYYSQCLPGAAAPTSAPTSAPPTSPTVTPTAPGSSVPLPSTTPTAGNPFVGYEAFLSPYYQDEVTAAVSAISDPTLKAKAAKVASVPNFTWFDVIAKVPTLGDYLSAASAKQASTGTKQLVQIVVYDLPDRDCAALASNGEFSIANNGLNNYKGYIDQIVAQVKKFPDVRIVAVIEPDSLANLVTNLNVQKCSGAQTAYKQGVTYAMQQLNAVGVYMYLDAGHAGWLGWPANLTPAAQLFAQLYKDAGSPQFVRGLATNVANFNALRASSPDPITQGNQNYDEIHYIEALAPALSSQGFPASFIVDQGRSGVQNIRQQWGDWCNVKGAGFGMRPTTNTGSSLIDAVVWVKPGGECDGTTNTSSPRYDAHCGLSDAAPNAPEAGTWFQSYFETLVSAANPAF
ncbi:Beta-glucosidase cel3A [Pleurotus ostreatus]|uniref:Glucanase n=1 Tax=Pleurotus ostreatus TaxID=5322 RepID=A0A8H7DY81_PLEOS|nr:Beta-glucosidase cel3A [Pleurotus ostreatus]KAF7440573.1 Beta-glucosidase cel3A [Pleurotus ostreatus]KAJ8700060.1 Beta-glucosidase cel3A [Pleurotus ostreatus]